MRRRPLLPVAAVPWLAISSLWMLWISERAAAAGDCCCCIGGGEKIG